MSKDINSEEYDAGTKLKLEILSSYVNEWLQVIINIDFIDTFYLYDFFAGSGTDSIGYHGSPLILLKHLVNNCSKLKEKGKKAELVLNDYVKRKIKTLNDNCEMIWEKCKKDKCTFQGTISCPIKTKLEARDFKDLFKDEYKILQTKNYPYCFIFIDQYGVKAVDTSIFNMLASSKHIDILFFTATAHAVRFSKNEDFQYHLGFDNFEGNEQYHRQLCQHYISLIPNGYEFYIAPFSIKKEDTGMLCGLIFGSSNLYGIEKFLNVAWKTDPSTGEANYDIDDDDIRKDEPVLFGEHYKPKKLDRFKEDLRQYLKKSRTNKDIYKFTLLYGFLPSHATAILNDLKNDNKLKVYSINDNETVRKGAYYINHNANEKVKIQYEQHKN